MKSLFAAIGVLALTTTAVYAGNDGGRTQDEFYAVARGDYSRSAPPTVDLSTIQIDRSALRSQVEKRPASERPVSEVPRPTPLREADRY